VPAVGDLRRTWQCFGCGKRVADVPPKSADVAHP
jgi:hypothetical protein